ncbi:putative tryptophanyl-tRNA synthetase [Durotheca rogersii]|uniref:putative tryptophanyl-tRNA synthetase n=1 Tax=Durotheca rogersii TaxID=419775 RepID=UPI00221FAAA4|nr:putative tryptophanyl-tRNA synthetase [Durotheca rogersii]KAI5855600.1 putative tryptophanyl-tRNA synthetase [Durotheca rogersii]
MSPALCVCCRPLAVGLARRRILYSAAQSRRRHQQRRNQSTADDSAASQETWEAAKVELPKPEGKIIFSAIQPTGVPHLGNYFGALRQWKQLQDAAQGTEDMVLFSIADLHAITVPQEPITLRIRRREVLASLLAVGIDPLKGSILFYQSSVPAHAELMWILSCTASMGYLGRMTQWKTKLQEHNKAADLDDSTMGGLKLGLFSYPVLQAADILIHRATHVPVGDDQRQHLEFTRECATNFNATYKSLLIPPQTVTSPSPRIMSFVNPVNKMSKSALNHRSRLLITADAVEIKSRIFGAVTDNFNGVTYDRENRPGVANLLEILSQCTKTLAGKAPSPREIAEDYASAGSTLAHLKADVTAALEVELEGVGDRYREHLERKGGKWLEEVEAECAEAARRSAERTMDAVRRAVGLA